MISTIQEKRIVELNDLGKLAQEILDRLSNLDKKRSTIVALRGNLGAGKTTFVQTVSRILGIKERVTSPTFVIMKNYTTPRKNQGQSLVWQNLIHLDCYRLTGEEDLLRLGWNEIVADKNNLILVEWPERVGKLLAEPDLLITFEVKGETLREIIYA